MGEQVAPLWQPLLDNGLQITFAHRTFAWESEAKGRAGVHVVIVGFEIQSTADKIQNSTKRLFDYPDIKGEPIEMRVSQISPYLIDVPSVIIDSRTKPLCAVPSMKKGNQPTDGGNLLLSPEEKIELLSKESQAERWLRPLLGAEEFINGKERWCLWLTGIEPHELRAMPEIMKRVAAVKEMRLLSSDAGTRELASRPTQFRESHEYKSYVLIPSVSSERRAYIPMGLFDGHTISTNLNLIVPNATIYHFGILQSAMHMAWMRTVCGRLESRYRYSAGIVYNNFPWPQIPLNPPFSKGEDNVNPPLKKGGRGGFHRNRSASRIGCPYQIPRFLPCRPVRPIDHATGAGQGTPQAGCSR
jgi:hypothetical protein